jgi:hypothetical protein
MNLSRKERITAYIAKWIVVNIACNINANAVLSLSITATRLYDERMRSE